jgi:L-serine/L-threonine ammonia-lyase
MARNWSGEWKEWPIFIGAMAATLAPSIGLVNKRMEASLIYARTPIFQSPALNARLGKTVHFKMESHQPTRSFKVRGMSHLVQEETSRGQNRFVASSGGNAGYSLAYAGKRMGAQVHVVVPETTQARMRGLIEGEGATVEVHGGSWMEAHLHALQVAESQQATYVPPFDNALLWAGHSSMMDECAAEIPEPDMVVAATGGGGLLCGIMEGMERNNWKRTVFLSAETEGAASYARAMEAGQVVTLDRIDTIATSLGAKQVAESAFEWSRRRTVQRHLCSDAEAVAAVRSLADAFNVLVEPACGAALSAVYLPSPAIASAGSILVIVCGGAGMDYASFNQYLERFGLN